MYSIIDVSGLQCHRRIWMHRILDGTQLTIVCAGVCEYVSIFPLSAYYVSPYALNYSFFICITCFAAHGYM